MSEGMIFMAFTELAPDKDGSADLDTCGNQFYGDGRYESIWL